MTINQVSKIIKEIGNYDLDMLIPLQEVNTIILVNNENMYTDDEAYVKFNSATELMEIYPGTTKDGIFTQKSSVPKVIIDIAAIQGFQLVSKYRRKSPYRVGQSM